MKKQELSNFFGILQRNNEDELKDFLLLNGKNPKSICPIEFVKYSEEENKTIKSEV